MLAGFEAPTAAKPKALNLEMALWLLALGLCCGFGVDAEQTPQFDVKEVFNNETKLLDLRVLMIYPGSRIGAGRLFLRGNSLGLNWNTGRLMNRDSNDQWSLTLTYTTPGVRVEVKSLLNDQTWQVGSNAIITTPANNGDARVFPWFGTQQGTVSLLSAISSPELGNSRQLSLYLPPSYSENTLKTITNLVIMHDGQNLFTSGLCSGCCPFGCWGIHTPLNNNIIGGQMEEVIVVGVFNTNNRISEYTYSRDPSNGGGNGEAYLNFLENTLIPFIGARYRVSTTRSATSMIGSSLGGLISCYGGYSRPQRWSKVGCMSSSFWWNNQDFNNVILPRFRQTPTTNFWLDSGDSGSSQDGMAQTITVRNSMTNTYG
jgi:predicted alpha/beta superfamily hydrolase